ncbi:hypothetical protein Plim_4183 [Planctopirus limnophila DSM 3776]|uniref:Uncharacterized protein n=1 Tax=Planctopirus limnophila (strain ATCC 43296 / DSM 3776 / IFAM 1008 / Mu 290) TaxID=521674 RepID=D5SZ91_PLAL2|nr:nucleotidyl transferase AbiEii/AbiGii toxin family protein [Planctopirus limnophila]ADG69992.1 hypothetical protein Plim_4183 [Planctopirus limnophila DSM 3776]
MFAPEEYRDTLLKISQLLNHLNIRFHLTGGIISAAYLDPRMTQDVDLVLDRQQLIHSCEDFINQLASTSFQHSPKSIRDAISHNKPFQLLDSHAIVKLDLYPRELIEGELNRSIMFEMITDLSLPIVSRPDFTLAKLVWISKGSHKSRRDLRKLYQGLKESEITVVEQKAVQLQLNELLIEVLCESDEII